MPSPGYASRRVGYDAASRGETTISRRVSTSPLSYRANGNLRTKVLDFVQSGGPNLTVGSTTFEVLFSLLPGLDDGAPTLLDFHVQGVAIEQPHADEPTISTSPPGCTVPVSPGRCLNALVMEHHNVHPQSEPSS